MRLTYGLAALSMLVALPPAPAAPAAQKPASAAPTATALVFPFTPVDGNEAVASALTANTISRLRLANKWDVAAYNARGPLVMRAVQDGTITRDQAAGPFDPAAASTIGRAIGVNAVVTGNVEEYSWDAASGTVKLTATAQATGVDGSQLAAATVGGQVSKAGATEQEVAAMAAGDIAGKLVQKLTGVETTAPVVKPSGKTPVVAPAASADTIPVEGKKPSASTPHKKKRSSTLMYLGGAALVGIIIAAAGGGGGNGGGGNGGSPPPLPF